MVIIMIISVSFSSLIFVALLPAQVGRKEHFEAEFAFFLHQHFITKASVRVTLAVVFEQRRPIKSHDHQKTQVRIVSRLKGNYYKGQDI